jgi:hypothetical protein
MLSMFGYPVPRATPRVGQYRAQKPGPPVDYCESMTITILCSRHNFRDRACAKTCIEYPKSVKTNVTTKLKYTPWQCSMACCKQGQAGSPSYVPKGSFQKVGCLPVYISSVGDSNNSSKSELQWISDTAISSSRALLLFFPDGFGLATHNLILADLFASRGWLTMVVDYFEG